MAQRALNHQFTDECFTITLDTGEEITWNTEKMNAAARSGAFGPPQAVATEDFPAPNWASGNLVRERVDEVKKDQHRLAEPVLAIQSYNSAYEVLCIADGQHRITARQELGLPECYL